MQTTNSQDVYSYDAAIIWRNVHIWFRRYILLSI